MANLHTLCRLRLHQTFNLLGAASVISGSILALVRLGYVLDILEDGRMHEIAGIIAFSAVIAWPILGFVRPHEHDANGKKTVLRVVWVRSCRAVLLM